MGKFISFTKFYEAKVAIFRQTVVIWQLSKFKWLNCSFRSITTVNKYYSDDRLKDFCASYDVSYWWLYI